ncbi:MAG: FKBP-type peptidyl-prolyl cis-trans isomerase, partial [Lautropia mirabilis]|nr:FKBP-type peptidyl-prolyl cis-trans isomerase [Lautropia mirabilis]
MTDSVSSESASLSSGAPAASEPARVGPQSFLTLHYRLSLPENGADVINTFEGKPATLQLGIGQMSEVLENCLVGMADGEHRIFELAPGEAFGPRNPARIQ